MTNIVFPSSPTTGQTFIAPTGVVYIFDGTKWVAQGQGGQGIPSGDIGTVQFNAGNGQFAGAANITTNGNALTFVNSPSGAADTIQYGLGNFVGYLDGGWVLGEYNGTDYGTTGMRFNPGIEGNVDIVLPANQDAANVPIQINNYVGNIQIEAQDKAWLFKTDGNLYLPDVGTPSINYANGQPYGGSGGGGNYGNANVAAYLPTYTGTVGANVVNFGATIAGPAAGGTTDKVTLYDFGNTAYNYAIGAEDHAVWFGVDNSAAGFKFYGGNAVAARIGGDGTVSATGAVSAASFTTIGSSGNISGANVISANTFSASGNITGSYAFFNDITLNDLSANAILYTDSDRNVFNTDFSYDVNNNIMSGGTISLTGNVTANNISTGNIYTNGYYYANGTPFSGGGGSGNATALVNGTNSFALDSTSQSILTLANVSGNIGTIQSISGAPDLLIDALTGNVVIAANDNREWKFDTIGSLTLPTLSLADGDEQTIIQSQRKIIPPFRWSVPIDGTTPTIVYTATDSAITSMKVTMQVQHAGLGFELFEVFATYVGSTDTYYAVNNRVAPPTIADSTVEVSLNGSTNAMEITVTVNSGATTSWVTYDAVEFGIPND